MSLQSNQSITAFSMACHDLWKEWLLGSNALQRKTSREALIKKAIVMTTGFMAPVDVIFPNLTGSYGSFSWGAWRLRIDNTFTSDDDITYDEFVELCCTVYHETRHAEQFYRIAQGLASGMIEFPDKSQSELIQDLHSAGGGRSVRDRIAAFEGKAMQESPGARRQMIAKWLNIPVNVAGTAETAKAGFVGYTQLAKPLWFKRDSTVLEVEEWMRSTYKRTMSGINEWAQSDHGPYKIYRDLPEEHDAHEIEELVKTAVCSRIGHNYASNKDKSRSDPVFGP